MTRIALAVFVASLFGNYCRAAEGEQQSPVSAPSVEPVKWPEYNSSPWIILEEKSLIADAFIPLVNKNDYVIGPARYEIRVGVRRSFIDSPSEPMNAVHEMSIFGSDPVIRALFSRDKEFALSRQILIDGKWQEIQPNWRIELEVDDVETVVYKGRLRGVTIRAMEGKLEKIKVHIEIKPPHKSKK